MCQNHKRGFFGTPCTLLFLKLGANKPAGGIAIKSKLNNRGHWGACEGSTYGLNTFLLVTLIGNLQNTTPPIPLSFFGQNDVQLRGRVVPPNSAKKESAKKNLPVSYLAVTLEDLSHIFPESSDIFQVLVSLSSILNICPSQALSGVRML